MSTSVILRARMQGLAGKLLFELPAAIPEGPPNRTVWVTEDILDVVNPVKTGSWTDYRHAQFRASLDAFTNWEEISVAEDPFNKDRDAFLARVHPVEAEFWDIRTVEPPQGMRCLGGFVDSDEFVAVVFDYRENFKPGEFDQLVERCESEWAKLFGVLPPLSGDSLDAYLTKYIAV